MVAMTQLGDTGTWAEEEVPFEWSAFGNLVQCAKTAVLQASETVSAKRNCIGVVGLSMNMEPMDNWHLQPQNEPSQGENLTCVSHA